MMARPRMFALSRSTAAALVCIAALSSASAQDSTLRDILIEGEDWELVAEGFEFTEGPAVDAHGRLYFSDVTGNKIYCSNRCKQAAYRQRAN